MLPPTAFGLNDCEEGGAARFNRRAQVAIFVFMSTARKKCLPNVIMIGRKNKKQGLNKISSASVKCDCVVKQIYCDTYGSQRIAQC